MTHDERARAERTERELNETDAAFAALRAAFVARLIDTKPGEADEREQLYLAVKVLDKVRALMRDVVQSAADTLRIEEAAEVFRAKPR